MASPIARNPQRQRHSRISSALALIALIFSVSIQAATFTVDTTADTGAGSLRQALVSANAATGADTILFAIPGAGPHTIAPQTPLPAITDTVLVDGWSQLGASANTLPSGWDAQIRIAIDGIALQSGQFGLRLASGAGSQVRGLSIYNIRAPSLRVEADNSIVTGNVIGMRPDGRAPNDVGHVGLLARQGAIDAIRASASGGRNIRIGGPAPADRNLVAGNTNGISARYSSGNIEDTVIQNNWLGLDGSGSSVVANNAGIFVTGGTRTQVLDNVVVSGGGAMALGPFPGQGSGMTIEYNCVDTVILRNRIGTGPIGDGISVGLIPFAVGSVGISVSNNTVGMLVGDPTDLASGNLFAHIGGVGAQISAPARRIAFAHNRFIDTGLISSGYPMAIDTLLPVGGNINDPLDADSGVNDLQNHPVLASTLTAGSSTEVFGELESAPDTTYRIELYASSYCPSNSRGHAERLAGSTSLTTNAAGQATLDIVVPALPSGYWLGATATDPLGNSSEIGPCLQIAGAASVGAVRFAERRFPVRETGTAVALIVQRIGGSAGAISVRVTSEDGTANAGLDYQAIDTTLTWADGDASPRNIALEIVYDLLTESREYFHVRLREPGGGTSLGMLSGTVVPIEDVPDVMFQTGFDP